MSKYSKKLLLTLILFPIISSCSLLPSTYRSSGEGFSNDESNTSNDVNEFVVSSITFTNSTFFSDYNIYNLKINDFECDTVFTDVSNYLRLGSSSKQGSIYFSFNEISIRSIYIYGNLYNDDSYSNLKLTLNNYSFSDTFKNNYLKFTFNENKSISNFTLETTSIGKRFNLSKIEFKGIKSSSDSTHSGDLTSSTSSSSDVISSTSSISDLSNSSDIKDKYNKVSKYVVETSILDIDVTKYDDPYENYTSSDIEDFYENYTISTSYVDAYYRSKHNLLSGEYILEDGTINEVNKPKDEETSLYYKNALVRYEVDKNGNYISYTINNLYGEDYKIYYGGIYTSMNDVSAYLFAFNEIPKNYYVGSKDKYKTQAYEEFGELGRVNFSRYSGPSSSKYQYEPYLKGQKDKSLYYREIDFGANFGSNYYYTYNDRFGGSNSRGTFRFLLSNSYDSNYTGGYDVNTYSTPNPTKIDDRYVYLTQNHYNDFREYLNYYNGWGTIFGNATAGNSLNKYNSKNPPTEFEGTILALF